MTRDDDFIQLETRFNECTKVVTSLKSEGQMFRDSVSGIQEIDLYIKLVYLYTYVYSIIISSIRNG